MTFEAGSALLNIHAVTARLIDRGRHFHLVEPTRSQEIIPPSLKQWKHDNPIQSANLSATPIIEFAGSSNPPNQSDGVAFVLRPPTVPKEECGSLNEAVHMEWLKGRGAAWISGSPELLYSKEKGSFQISVTDCASPMPDLSAPLVTESGLAAALDTLEDAALDECVSRHLTEGGDDRLHLSEEGVNRYFCPPRPLLDDVVVRGSCTCSSPTRDGFEASRVLLRQLWSGRASVKESMADIRRRLSNTLGISVPHEVILHPSGSDAELVPLAIASVRAQAQGCSSIVNIVAAAGEVGSGTAPAAGGRHFSEFTPCGGLVQNGAILDDFPHSTQVVELKPRDSDGNCINNYDKLVLNVVDESFKASESPFFVVHAVDGSKTGLRLPSQELLESLSARLGENLLVVMDACQCRSEPEELNWFLSRGAIVLVTASKFYCAPGFCGAVLIPTQAARVLAGHPAPAGLKDYLTKYEVPDRLTRFHSSLPDGPKNVGLLLRWACGITEMELFAKRGNVVKEAIREWVYGVRKLICQRRPALDLIDIDCAECIGDETRAGGVNSVVSIKLMKKSGGGYLDACILRRVHRYLTIDASKFLPGHASEEERTAASLRCMVGQPVNLGCFGVLRLAIGAPMARDLTEAGRLNQALKQDGQVLDKMMVLSKYIEEML